MKKILFTLFALMAVVVLKAQDPYGYPVDQETHKYTYMEIVPTEGSTKDQLYNKAKTWATLNKYTILKDDKEKGEITFKGAFKVKYISPMPGLYHDGNVSWTMTVSGKDGKYRYVLTDFLHTSAKGNGGKLESKEAECGKALLTNAGWGTIKKDSKVKLEELVATFKKMMSAAESGVKSTGDDW